METPKTTPPKKPPDSIGGWLCTGDHLNLYGHQWKVRVLAEDRIEITGSVPFPYDAGGTIIVGQSPSHSFVATKIENNMDSARGTLEVKVELLVIPSEPCDLCGGVLVEKTGTNGKFLGCENFPTCDQTGSRQEAQRRARASLSPEFR